MLALDGGADGLDLVRRLVGETPAILKSDGWLLLEIGSGQAETTALLFQSAGWREIAAQRDLGGVERVVLARKPETT